MDRVWKKSGSAWLRVYPNFEISGSGSGTLGIGYVGFRRVWEKSGLVRFGYWNLGYLLGILLFMVNKSAFSMTNQGLHSKVPGNIVLKGWNRHILGILYTKIASITFLGYSRVLKIRVQAAGVSTMFSFGSFGICSSIYLRFNWNKTEKEFSPWPRE